MLDVNESGKGNSVLSSLQRVVRAMDWNCQKKVLGRRYVRRSMGDFFMYLDTKVPGISRTLAIHRKREEDMCELIRRALKPGMTVLDCGSNIGYYPLFESELVGKTGKIICIEPDPRNFELLTMNIKQAKYQDSFELHHMAVSDKNMEVALNLTKYSNLNKVVSDTTHLSQSEVYRLPADSIDNLVKKHRWSFDFLRMDIEGHEVEVIRGARETIKAAKSGFTIFLELHPTEYSQEHSFAEQLSFLLDQGFECEYLVSAGQPIPPLYGKLGYQPSEVISTDGLMRGIYTGVKNRDHIISLACDLPKASRYIMLRKK